MRIITGYLISLLIAAVTFFILGQIFTMLALRAPNPLPFPYLAFQLASVFAIMLVVVLPFFAVVVWVSEKLRIRHWTYYATCGGATSLVFALPLMWLLRLTPHHVSLSSMGRGVLGYVGSGIVGGLVYWARSGRWAGGASISPSAAGSGK
jgi:hypothetical protein